MLYLAILLSAAVIYFVQAKLYEKYTTERLTYHVRLSTEECFAGEDIFLYEELTNDKPLPLPFVKVNADLPDGLFYHFIDRTGEEYTHSYEQNTQSVYVLESFQKISRRWRISCRTRGIYRVGRNHLVTNDLFGLNSNAIAADSLSDYSDSNLVVLPDMLDLQTEYISADGFSGDVIANHSLLTDPLLIAGTREYRNSDAMRTINWMSSAAHSRLMVNVEEHFREFRFNIILNMQSRNIEKYPEVPSAVSDVEQCIRVVSTLLGRAASEERGVRLYLNAPRSPIIASGMADKDTLCPVSDDETGWKIASTVPCHGKRDLIDGLRLLAAIPMQISVPEERFLSHILAYPEAYTLSADGVSGANLIFVTSYFSERMIAFHRAMAERSVNVIYYVTSAGRNAQVLPPDIEIYFSVGSLSSGKPKASERRT